MKIEQVVRTVLKTLNDHQHAFMLVGSYATNTYCVPRGTQDVDLVIESEFVTAARDIGKANPDLILDRQIGFESVTGTKKMVLTEKFTDFKVEVFELGDDPHHIQRFARRLQVDLLGQRAWVASAEDTVITKLQWSHSAARPKDLDDVQKVIAAQYEMLDWPYIEQWCVKHGTQDRLAELRVQLGV